jgi:hypothetical protein
MLQSDAALHSKEAVVASHLHEWCPKPDSRPHPSTPQERAARYAVLRGLQSELLLQQLKLQQEREGSDLWLESLIKSIDWLRRRRQSLEYMYSVLTVLKQTRQQPAYDEATGSVFFMDEDPVATAFQALSCKQAQLQAEGERLRVICYNHKVFAVTMAREVCSMAQEVAGLKAESRNMRCFLEEQHRLQMERLRWAVRRQDRAGSMGQLIAAQLLLAASNDRDTDRVEEQVMTCLFCCVTVL